MYAYFQFKNVVITYNFIQNKKYILAKQFRYLLSLFIIIYSKKCNLHFATFFFNNKNSTNSFKIF